ncbi:hypothetical protein F5146DRAFT_143261 [Armillaria mellea]|nr:hypothetical protein F5146DRAFT_143261 [Armillaria mellea]
MSVRESQALTPIASLVEIMLCLIKGHHESILYHWTRHPGMQDVWPACLSQLVQWALGEKFRRWVFLNRVLAITVVGELLDILGQHDDKKLLLQYDYEAYADVNQPPWLSEISSSGLSRDGEPDAVEYSVDRLQHAQNFGNSWILFIHRTKMLQPCILLGTPSRSMQVTLLEMLTVLS